MSTSDEADWEITREGLYVATRGFLVRRGYCCANRCRHCPYINWHNTCSWQHGPHAAVQSVLVSKKALAEVREHLHYHQLQLQAHPEEISYHEAQCAHYRFLLQQWANDVSDEEL